MAIVISRPILAKMVEEGLVPKDCRNVSVDIPASGPPILRYELFLSRDKAAQFAKMFALIAEDIHE